MYVLGIDGGGTKTTAVITMENGNIILSQTVGPTNPNSIGHEKVEEELARLFHALKKAQPKAYEQIEYVFAGMSGVGRPEDVQKMTAIIAKYLPDRAKIVVDNDAPIALYSGTLGEPGVVNICGTGNITFGINEKNERMRVGGWGYLLGDPGSGYSIGRLALQHVFADYDRIGPRTLLTPLVLDHFQLNNLENIVPIIYEQGKARGEISSLAKLVFEAANEGDVVSKQILHKTAVDMATSIKGLLNNLYKDYPGKVPVVLAGGIYQQHQWFLPIIKKELAALQLNLDYIVPSLPPVAGAVCAALKMNDRELADNFSFQ